MSELFWTASSKRNWLWFSHIAHPIKVGVHCSSMGSICYEIAGKTTTLLLNGKQVPGARLPFSTPNPQKALLEGEKSLWTWTLSRGSVELTHRPSGRRVSFHSAHCLVQDHNREHTLECAEINLEPKATQTRSEPHPATQPTPPTPGEPPPVTALREQSVEPVAIEPSSAGHWTNDIPEEMFRRVFKHLERHGSITEDQVTELLDSTRLARSFGNKLDFYRSTIPFEIQVDATGSGQKVYRKL